MSLPPSNQLSNLPYLHASRTLMSEQDLYRLPLGQTLIAAISQLFDSVGVPTVLWENILLTVYGIPSATNECQKSTSLVVDSETNILPRMLHSWCLMI